MKPFLNLRVVALLSAILLAGCHRDPKQQAASFVESAKKSAEKKDYLRAILDLRNASKLTPNDPEISYRLGMTYLLVGNVRDAVISLRQTLDLNPKHVGAQAQLAQLMSGSSNNEVVAQAQQRAEAILADNPGNPDALSILALTEMRLGDPKQAESHLKEAIDKYPQHLNASVTLANLKLQQKDLKGAEEVLKAAAEKAPEAAAPITALGRFYLMTGKPGNAEVEFQKAVRLDSKNPDILNDLAMSQLAAGHKIQAEDSFRQLSALPDKKYKSTYATFLFSNGRREAAVAEYEKLVKADPDDRLSRSRLVAAYIATGKVPEAAQVLVTALKRNAQDTDALLQRGEIFIASGHYTEAQTDLLEVARVQPDSARAHYMLSQVYRAQGIPIREREELTTAVQSDPGFLDARITLAKSLLTSGSTRAALDLMNTAPQAQKNSPAWIAGRNWVLQEMGDASGLQKGIEQGLAIARTRELLLQDALLKLSQKNYASARKSAEEVLADNPEDLGALEDLMLSYAAEKQMPAAVKRARELVVKRPQSAPLQHFLGRCLLRAGDAAGARSAFAAAVAADSGYKPAAVALSQLEVAEGKLDEARKTLTNLIAAKPRDFSARLMLGMVEERAGNLQGAMEAYGKAVEFNDQNAAALNNYAYLLASHAKRPDEALKLAEKANELVPNNPVYQDTLGWILYKKGLYGPAVKQFEQAVAKQPTGLQKLHLALGYLKQGDEKRGRELLTSALALDPKLSQSSDLQEFLTTRNSK